MLAEGLTFQHLLWTTRTKVSRYRAEIGQHPAFVCVRNRFILCFAADVRAVKTISPKYESISAYAAAYIH